MSEANYTVQQENASEISVAIKKPSSRYVDRLLKSKCGPDLIASGVFPNTKELTESYACLRAAEKMGEDLSDRTIQTVCVGDGSTPRTAATFAFNSGWFNHSVDPQLKLHGMHPIIHRVMMHPDKIESLTLTSEYRVIVIACHSHALLTRSLQHIHAPSIGLISMSCCVPDDLNQAPDKEYADWGCWSPHRVVRIWKEIDVARLGIAA